MIDERLSRTLLFAAALLSTGEASVHSLRAEPNAGSLDVHYAGCLQVILRGPTCALSESPATERTLRLGVHLPAEARIEIEAGEGHWRRAELAPVGNYLFIVRNIPPRASAVRLRASLPQGAATWTLALMTPRSPSLVKEATDLQTSWQKSGDEATLKQARQLLEFGAAGLGAEDQGFAWSLLARVDQNLADEAGARRSLTRSIPFHHAAGQVLAEADDSALLAWLEIQRRDFSAARKVLSGLELPSGSPDEAFFFLHYHLGLLADQVGDSRSALANLDAAAAEASRVGLVPLWFMAEEVLARQLQSLGRSREAAAIFQRLSRIATSSVGRCGWAEMRVNGAWSLILAGEAGESRPDPVPFLEQADMIASRYGCYPNEAGRLNYLINLSLAHFQAGRIDAARRSLTDARSRLDSAKPLERVWFQEIEARLALQSRNPLLALRQYSDLARLAAHSVSPEGAWRAEFGKAQAYVALHRTSEALASYREAETLLEAQSLQVPMNEGRDTFAAQRGRATSLYLELLLDSGRKREAFETARRARSRFLRELARGDRLAQLGPADQQTWDRALSEYRDLRTEIDRRACQDLSLPSDQGRAREAERKRDEGRAGRVLDGAYAVLGGTRSPERLPPLRPGEVVLAYHPLSRGWVGFADDGKRVVVTRFELTAATLGRPDELADRLLAPFRSQIETAKRLRVLPFGLLRSVDFHALPFGGPGHILLERLPVVYGLDLAPPATRRAGLHQELHALIVANPTWARSDLPGSEDEARAVATSLEAQSRSWKVEMLKRDEATAEAVQAALKGVGLLHYAGHGRSSGFGGWASELPLAKDTRLTLSDLLALDQEVPRRVVLSGCETGKTSASAPAEGLSLAHAFLLGGASEVIAATRPVHDYAAQRLFADLYRGWAGPPDLATRLRLAQLAAWRNGVPADDWAAFRAFEP